MVGRIVFLISVSLCLNSAYGLCVSEYQTRLRAEPSSAAKVTWVVGRYMPLIEKDRKGSWIQVQDMDGETHWVSAGEVTSKERCVVVKSRQASLRQSPSRKAPFGDVASVDRYTAFKRLEADPEDWYWVEDEVGTRFWIPAKDVWRPVTVSKVGF